MRCMGVDGTVRNLIAMRAGERPRPRAPEAG